MAVIDPNKKKQNADATEEKSARVVDLFTEKDLPQGEKFALDKNEDAWAFAAPHPYGDYFIKVQPAKEFTTFDYFDKENKTGLWYALNMECKLIVDDKEVATLFPRVNTIIPRGKKISTAAGLIIKLGFGKNLADEMTPYEVAKLCATVIRKEKVTKVLIDWQGYSKDFNNGKDKKSGKVVFNSMYKFPQDAETGNYEHIADFRHADGHTEEIKAQLQVVHWYGKGEESVMKAAPTKGTGAGSTGATRPSQAVQGLLVADDEALVVPTQVIAPTPVAAPATTKLSAAPVAAPPAVVEVTPQVAQDDASALLEDDD